MILEPAIANLTSNLDEICQQDGKGISSNEKLKEKALNCLQSLIKNAPSLEYRSLVRSKDSEILLGYLLSVLCRLIKSDKSRSIRFQSIDTIGILVDQLSIHHDEIHSSKDGCSVEALVLALPGVSSVLFKLIISDTKLPKRLILKSIQVLGKLMVTVFSSCDLKTITTTGKNDLKPHLVGDNLTETCDNISVRLSFMLEYISTNSDSLHNDVKIDTLNICYSILKVAPLELVSRLVKPVVRYMAFIQSNLDKFDGLRTEIQLQLMFITDEMKYKILNHGDKQEQLETAMLSCLFELLDKLESNRLTMLQKERQSELQMLCGLLKMLPSETMTTLMELPEKKEDLFAILVNLTEFSSNQPLLFLTHSEVNENAVQQLTDNRIYTIEKRFAHLNDIEVEIVNTCCSYIGQTVEWPLLMDIFRSTLTQFSSPSNLYVTQQVIKGCLTRTFLSEKETNRFTSQTIQQYQDVIDERLHSLTFPSQTTNPQDTMIAVIAIETIVTLIQLHLKASNASTQTILILKDLLCPLLNWCSSSSRAISEAALSAMNQISVLYGFKSTNSLIEANTDYIIDGVTKMLDNFACNPQVTNVLAITFKLSSIQTFYFFKDVYDRVFKVLARYHQTKSVIPLSRLLFRTICILDDWRLASGIQNDYRIPLTDELSYKLITDNLNIDRTIQKLQDRIKEAARINESMKNMKVTEEQEASVAHQIESGNLDLGDRDQEFSDSGDTDPKKDCRQDDIILTEKILKHCVGLMSSNHHETKILALRTAARGLAILCQDENTLLPLVHQLWSPLLNRLNQNYIDHLEENLCAFECLVSMAEHSKDFIKRRALDTIIPRLCIFLESQASSSRSKKEYEPYCMTMQYKCQKRVLSKLGKFAYHTQISYTSLWRIIEVTIKYLEDSQVPALRDAASSTLEYLVALDADCVWFFAKRNNKLGEIKALNLVLDLH